VKSYFIHLKIFVLLILFGINFFVWIAPVFSTQNNLLEVSYLNVGQGDAILITSPTENQMLIDGGPDGSILRELPKVMKLSDRSIDVVLATHPDRDHINGLIDVLSRYEVTSFINSEVESENSIDEALLAEVKKEGATGYYARRGMKIDLGDGGVVEVLFPDRNPKGMDTNDASIIMKLLYGETCFLFTGDSSSKIENYLIGLEKEKLRCDVLKAGHHGSRTSTSKELLHFVKPTIAIISAGKDNSYGHPHAEVVSNLKAASTTIVSTAEEGTIVFRSDGKQIVKK
jgi:competence protein ComEC